MNGIRGRKPKPTNLKRITGNPGRRPLKAEAVEIRPPVILPEAPAHIEGPAREEWDRVARQLFALRILTALDTAALGAYCQAYGVWVQASQALAKLKVRDPIMHGLMLKTSNDNWIQNPLVGTINKAAADMVRYAAEFGMTPSARARIAAGAPGSGGEGSGDDAEKYFN